MEPDLESSAPGVSLQEYVAILSRRRAIILQAFVLITVVGLVVTLLTRPVYQASARLLVEAPSLSVNSVDASNPLSTLMAAGQPQSLSTQVEVLQSPDLVAQVLKTVGPATLTVGAVKDTNIIEVDAEANDPKVAAAAPNALLQTYISQDTNQSLTDIRSAEDFARKQGAAAHAQLLLAETQMRAFQQQHHVADLTLDRQQQIALAGALGAALQKQRTDLAALQAQIGSERALMAQAPASHTVRTQTTNPNIAALQGKIDALVVERKGMLHPTTGFTPQSFAVQPLTDQINELKRQQAAQPPLVPTETITPNAERDTLRARIIDLEAQASPLRAQAAATQAQLAQAQALVGHFAGWAVAYDRLTRDHDAAAGADKMFADRLADLTLREKAFHADARVLQVAQAPTDPVRPKKAQSVLFAALIGLFVGACLALLQEFLDDRINSAEDASRALSLPSLGYVPALTSADARLLPLMQGMDPAAESYRVLRTNIHFASVDAPVRTLLVTSALPGEGKTTTSANLAFAMAMDGKRVALVDTDLRKPSIGKLLSLPSVPGLTDVLLGHAALEDVLLEHESMPALSIVVSGSTPPNPSELLNSRAFRNQVERLTELFDVVIFDSPPIMVAADAVILASQMDGTVLVVETGETRKAAARQAVGLLRQAHATLLGVAYNKMRALNGYGYYYNYQYTLPADGKAAPKTVAAPALPAGEAEGKGE